MAEFNDLAERINSALIIAPDTSISDNTHKELVSNTLENFEENDSFKGDGDSVTPDIKVLSGTTSNMNETCAPMSSKISDVSRFIDGCNMEEVESIKTEENATEPVNSTEELSEETNSESETVVSILTYIQNNFQSDCSIRTTERNPILVKIMLNARQQVLLIFTRLQDHCVVLLEQKKKIVLMKKELLKNTLNALNDMQQRDLSSDVEQIVKETLSVCLKHKKEYAACKSILEAFVRNVQRRVANENVVRRILEQHTDYFSTLEDIYTNKSLLESSMKAFEEFEDSIKNFIKVPNQDSESKIIDLLLGAIHKADLDCTELMSFGKVLEKLFDCIGFCVRIADK